MNSNIKIIGCGGIKSGVDAYEYILCGATMVQVGTEFYKEDTIIYYGIGYDLGGGVNTWVQLDDINHSDGDHATTEVDPQIIMAGISLGF